MKIIKIYTNIIHGGFGPEHLENKAGGSEEKLIELANYLAKDNDVTIYHNGTHGVFNNVKYIEHQAFNAYEPCDLFISFKNREIIRSTINAKKIVYFTTEVEQWKQWEADLVDNILVISNYHKSRMNFNSKKLQVQYLWADLERLEKNKAKKEKGTMLYSSSFDRGLEQLLERWPEIQKRLKLKKLYITYGWDFIDQIIKNNPGMMGWKNRMLELMKQKGVEYIGGVSNDEMCKYYWRSEYWCLPPYNPDSELFCINAVKAEYAESIPVVRRIGGLQETVNRFIDFDQLIGEKVGKSTFEKGDIDTNKKHALQFSYEAQIQKWITLISL